MLGNWQLDSINNVDLFALCDGLPDASVDMILADLPYGTTACSWDTVIPFEPMWERFKRVIKPRGAIVLTASQPFTSALVMSNVAMFRYEWVWDKKHKGNIFLAEQQPLKVHENTLVFGVETPAYYPQMRKGKYRMKDGGGSRLFSGVNCTVSFNDDYYPVSIIEFSNANQADKQHPTQKPVALFEYLIRTYTREGELVLDPTAGSGTTGLAARNCGRHFIMGDTSAEYVEVARKRLDAPYTPRLFGEGALGAYGKTDKAQSGSQLSLLPEPSETPETV